MRRLLMLLFCLTLALPAWAEKKTKVQYRKTQEVSFDGDSIDGQARTPTGAYLVQKRGVDFLPMYKLREKFDNNIKESIDYLR